MLEVNYLLLTLRTDRQVHLGASPLSLYISSAYQKEFGHNSHTLSGGSYPLLQYKVIRGSPLIVAINEGRDFLWKIYKNLDSIDCGGSFTILEKRIIEKKALLGPTEKRLKYRFLTPWLTTTEAELVKSGGADRIEEALVPVIESNLRGLSRNFGIPIEGPISAGFHLRNEHIVQKESGILGFLGTFYVNYEIPQFLGLGRGVSRGFGTVKQS